ncbi:hypoxanthine phosphoribosyltransferase [Candidatus Borkfalkia ceftriaxoniphila]|jgi:hypoxanthine phosphoribosyltransferase|uniref:Hypoxanthine phosphoribosyltransferase n=1 Tax=Candidatus Borkfalkia ceftriaxoniphila TaxID=2508949 RepID=A0A4Q2KD05_9FIRM|nr:hypoxanthine phosphoribosyltransferase [Candidatus Borkfalkia ceftriaxoniphila]RXZ61402.1 hypoxanthine phosphoribosyltransferase [Candidatus Borkfalkia ceftriaxoniphila]
MHPDVDSILISEEQIKKRIQELAVKLDKEYEGKRPLMVSILKGSVMFYADLLRAMSIPVEMDFMAISSYGAGAKSSGEVKLIKDLDRKIEGRDVVIVEDIIDSGYTLSYLKRMLYSRKPASVKICALLDKYARRVVPIEADFKGFDIEDEFVIGYGLDYAERYRNLPYIGILKRSVYEK